MRYGALSEDLGNWRERIAPGAFRATLGDGHDIRMLFSHDQGRLLASTKSGTMSLADTTAGLTFRATMPNTVDGDTCLELCRRGDLRELSFGFQCRKEDWADEDIEDPDDDFDPDRGRSVRRKKRIAVRTVKVAHLIEISPVGWPAYSGGVTHIRPEMTAAAAAGSRSLFPSGVIPVEIRSRVPGIVPYRAQYMTDAERAIYARALKLETRADL